MGDDGRGVVVEEGKGKKEVRREGADRIRNEEGDDKLTLADESKMQAKGIATQT